MGAASTDSPSKVQHQEGISGGHTDRAFSPKQQVLAVLQWGIFCNKEPGYSAITVRQE